MALPQGSAFFSCNLLIALQFESPTCEHNQGVFSASLSDAARLEGWQSISHQIPLSFPVKLCATSAEMASGGSNGSRSSARTSPCFPAASSCEE